MALLSEIRKVAEEYSAREHQRRLDLDPPEKLTREETREYLADLEWVECEPCRGTGCAECADEGGKWEADYD